MSGPTTAASLLDAYLNSGASPGRGASPNVRRLLDPEFAPAIDRGLPDELVETILRVAGETYVRGLLSLVRARLVEIKRPVQDSRVVVSAAFPVQVSIGIACCVPDRLTNEPRWITFYYVGKLNIRLGDQSVRALIQDAMSFFVAHEVAESLWDGTPERDPHGRSGR